MLSRLIAGGGRAALLEDGDLADIRVDEWDLSGSIVIASVDRIHTGLNVAFIRMADGEIGLLSGRDARDRGGRRPDKIGQALSQGQRILVQIVATDQDETHDEAAREHKGPRLTQDLTLPGRFLVHKPLGHEIHLSKRLKRHGFELPPAVKSLLRQGGWIVRQAAAAAPPELLVADAIRLQATADEVLANRAALSAADPVILPPPRAIARLALTLPADGIVELAAADSAALADLAATMAPWPDLAAALPRMPAGPDPLADDAVADGLRLAGQTRIPLPTGGDIIIETTAALTAIDVNGGETGRGEALGVNLAAAPVIARQLRLRNLGGPVLVDVLRLYRPVEQERLINAFAAAAVRDPLGLDIYGFTALGLLELARPRRGLPLAALHLPSI